MTNAFKKVHATRKGLKIGIKNDFGLNSQTFVHLQKQTKNKTMHENPPSSNITSGAKETT